MDSVHIDVRLWAYKCGAAFCKMHGSHVLEVFNKLWQPLQYPYNSRLWVTCISALFEIIDQFGLDCFELEDENDLAAVEQLKQIQRLRFPNGNSDAPEPENFGKKKSKSM